jgi:hypothetical protein
MDVDCAGWIHGARLYVGEEKEINITFTNPIQIDQNYYDVISGVLSPEDIDKFIKSVNPNWDTTAVWK